MVVSGCLKTVRQVVSGVYVLDGKNSVVGFREVQDSSSHRYRLCGRYVTIYKAYCGASMARKSSGAV